jgi:deoxyribonuclease-4
MAGCDRMLGLERVHCIHLNDSKKPLGCRVDRHEEVGRGAIGLTPFRCLMNDPRFVNTIGILETPFPERYGEAIRHLESLRRRK